jgi:hypothetical protein
MKFSEFDVPPKHKRIIVFKLDKLWAFKHFFHDSRVYDELLDFYKKSLYRSEFNRSLQGTTTSRSWNETASTMG